MIITETTPDVIFSDKRVEEAELFEFNFSRVLPAGDSIVSARITGTVINGKGNAAGMIDDAPIVSSPRVQQMIRGGAKNTTYHFRFIATTLNGLRLVGIGQLTVID